MKILFVIESFTSGGKERRLLSLIKGMLLTDTINIEIIILSEDIHYKEIYDLDINIHFLKRSAKKDLGIFNKFSKILKKFKPDVVHCWDNVAALHFGPICNWYKVPFINSMITTAPPVVPKLSKEYLIHAVSFPFSDILLANSKAGLKSYSVSKDKGRYIYNGIDSSRKKNQIAKHIIRNNFNITTDFVVGMTGAFYDRKDYETFVKAGALVLNKRKDVTFLAIGGGPNLEKIKNLVSDAHASNFRFVGKQQDVDSIVNIFTIGVLSTYTEGISNAIMEYMAFSKPVIATDGGGTSELVLDNETGFLVNAQDEKQLAEKIEYLLENPDRATQMGKNGMQRIEEHFTIKKMTERTIELYKEQLS